MTCDPWPLRRSCLPALPQPTDDDYEDAVQDQKDAIKLAVDTLWAASGRQFGVCETTVRPCVPGTTRGQRREYLGRGYGGYAYAVWDGSGWGSDTGCGCDGACEWYGDRAAHLPGPVVHDDEHLITVVINGDVIANTDWVLEGDVLYRVGEAWPKQNMNRASGEDGTWSVTYWRGQPVPRGVGRYVCILAAEILKASNGEKCELPANARRVVRQGISLELDPLAILSGGRTGILVIDRWLQSVNPNKLMQPPSVL